MNALKIIAVIPVYNTERKVGTVIKGAKKHADKVIAVIDGSADDSLPESMKAGAVIVENDINRGLGFTLRRGTEEAIRDGADIIVTLDSDGQHDPDEIPKLVEELKKNKLDVVIGSRLHDENMPSIKKFGNWTLTRMSGVLFGSSIRDTQSGFKAYTPSAYKKMKWAEDGFSVCSEIAMRIAANKLKCKEVTIKTIYGEGQKTDVIDVIDGIKIGLSMLRWKFLD